MKKNTETKITTATSTTKLTALLAAIILTMLSATACAVASESKPDKNIVEDKGFEEVTIEATGDFSIKTDEVEISVGTSGIKIDTTKDRYDIDDEDEDIDEIDKETTDAVESLYAYQLNFSKGTANLNIIPVPVVEEVYDEYDDLKEAGIEHIPIMIREYAGTNTVYFDYDTDTSIVWEKDTGEVTIQKTDIAEREDFKQKEHKL